MSLYEKHKNKVNTHRDLIKFAASPTVYWNDAKEHSALSLKS